MELPFAVEDEPDVKVELPSTHTHEPKETSSKNTNVASSSSSSSISSSTSLPSNASSADHHRRTRTSITSNRSASTSTSNRRHTLNGSISAGSGSNKNRTKSTRSVLPVTSPHAYQNVNVNANSNSSINTHEQKQNQTNSQQSHSHSHSQSQSQSQQQQQQHGTMNIMSNATGARTNLHRVALYDNVHPHFYTPKPLSAVNGNGNGNGNVSSTHSNSNSNSNRNTSLNMEASMIRVSAPSYSNTNDSSSSQHQNSTPLFTEEDFVTINAADPDESYHDNDHIPSQSQNHGQIHGQHHPGLYHQYHKPSMETKNHLSASKISSNTYGHQMDILSLLLSSVSVSHTSANDNGGGIDIDANHESEGGNGDDEIIQKDHDRPANANANSNTNKIMDQCEAASEAAAAATRCTKEGDIDEAVKCHVRSANAYKTAAMLLKKEHGNGNGTGNGDANGNGSSGNGNSSKSGLSLLAYSLLVLSNAQARSADCLVKHGGVHFAGESKGSSSSGDGGSHSGSSITDDNGKSGGRHGPGSSGTKGDGTKLNPRDASTGRNSGAGNSHPEGGKNGRNEGTRAAGKEDRLRAKIRASLNTAEADMTDSTFLGRASSTGNAGANAVRQGMGMGASVNTSTSIIAGAAGVNRPATNPVDDMMELEQELKDMDATLNMGVNLGSSISSLATKKSLEGSFCVVPGSGGNVGSSYMSSSMMWASGMGGRPVAAQQHSSNTKNRVQTHLGASVSLMHKSPSIGGHQQLHQPHHQHQHQHINHGAAPKHHPGLESSWWGQASALASSTSSLSNSMVGIRSSNVGTGGNHMNAHNAASPANNKQVFRLLDSLRTLGDENAALLREVEETKKAQAEAKAAREAMRQFKQDYKQRFTKLKMALDKHKRDNNINSNNGSGNPSNLVANSNFMKKTEMQQEIQKRDLMIQKLKNESSKKDDALRKYEKFYQQVKLRSDQKKRQKESESK